MTSIYKQIPDTGEVEISYSANVTSSISNIKCEASVDGKFVKITTFERDEEINVKPDNDDNDNNEFDTKNEHYALKECCVYYDVESRRISSQHKDLQQDQQHSEQAIGEYELPKIPILYPSDETIKNMTKKALHTHGRDQKLEEVTFVTQGHVSTSRRSTQHHHHYYH